MSTTSHAGPAEPATPDPTRENAPATTGADGAASRTNTSNANGTERKAWATLQARFALAGIKADLIEDDAGQLQLIASRWALTRSFSSVGEASDWLDRFGGRPT